MKTTVEDFQDKLAGRQDKPAAVEAIKEAIKVSGLNISIQRRKLAGGTKIYFTITPPDKINDSAEWLRRAGSISKFTVDIIQKYFPKARVTSGGAGSWTISEY